MSEGTHRLNVEGLPKQFVSSLKVLFDILDEDRSGYIRLVDIESRWNGEGVRGLPVGVIEALRKVTPASGFLSFDRFVMGLKLAMFKSKHNYIDSTEDSRRTPTNEFQNSDTLQQQRSYNGVHSDRDFGGGGGGGNGSVGIIQLHHIHPTGSSGNQQPGQPQANLQGTQRTYGTAITATVRPNNAINTVNPVPAPSVEDRQHRGLHSKSNGNTNANMYSSLTTNMANSQTGERERYTSPPPPRPLRTPLQAKQHPPNHPVDRGRSPHENSSKVPPQVPPRDYRKSAKSVIINELKQWQKTQIKNYENHQSHSRITSVSSDSRLDKKSNPNSDIYVNVDELQKSEEHLRDGRPTSKVQARRREPRRHTVANGVDYNMVKRMKQFEEEKDMLRQGLEALDKAREWYQKQISSVEVKQRNFTNASPSDISVEEHQEKLNQQRACINELNQRLKALIGSSRRGIPVHMNLAVKSVTYSDETITINMLKEQNRQLTKEVGDKGKHITQLEREKASLIREMFEVRARAKNKTNYDDTTFM